MRLVLCDDHGMFLDALIVALALLGHEVVASSETLDDITELTARYEPDVCVMGVGFSGRTGIDVAATIRNGHTEVLLLTGMATDEVWRSYDTGVVNGVVNKVCDFAVLNRAINKVACGERVIEGFARPITRRIVGPRPGGGLTARERDVLRLLTQGVSTEEMAVELGVSMNTVRTHVQNVLHKLGVNGRSKAVRIAVGMDLVGMATTAR